MKWTRKELVVVMGYYKNNKNKTSGELYWKHQSYFKDIQDRDIDQVKSTFRIKLNNLHSIKTQANNMSGGLNKNKLYIQTSEDESWHNEYQEMINEINNIDESLYSKFASLKNGKENKMYDIDLNSFENNHEVAKVVYKTAKLREYLEDVARGKYKVPLFQREFAWSKNDIIAFLNAINKGYPFGNITVWIPNNESDIFESINEVIKKFVENNKSGNVDEATNWIIDGQQRTTALVSMLIGKMKHFRKNKDIVYSFDENEFKSETNNDINCIPIEDILRLNAFDTSYWINKYGLKPNDATKIKNIQKRIFDNNIGITIIKKAGLDIAIDIFTKMNTRGKKLSLFNLVHAKWLTENIKIDMGKEIESWVNVNMKRNYKPDSTTVVKALYLTFDKSCVSGEEILNKVIDDEMINDIKVNKRGFKSLTMAVDFLQDEMGFKGEIMPSSNLFKFMSYAFSKNNNESFTSKQGNQLKRYIKYVCVSNMYSSSTGQRLKDNMDFVDGVINNSVNEAEEATRDEGAKIKPETILDMKYGANSSLYYFVINKLFNKAKALTNNESIPPFSSDKTKSEINIHHIIPKKQKFNDEKVIDMKYGNSLANLVPIRKDENMKISNKYPADYIELFSDSNDNLEDTLKNMCVDYSFLASINKDTKTETLNSFWEERAGVLAKLCNKD